MKIKLLSTYPKQTLEIDNLFFSSDLHLFHSNILIFGRKFNTVQDMNYEIIVNINSKVGKNDMLVLLGDTLFGEKDYSLFLNSLNCENVILLFGNHCSRSKLTNTSNNKLKYYGDYLELVLNKQIICCNHYPQFHWNYMSDGSLSLHGHNHAFEDDILKHIHKYKSLDVGIDNYYKLYGSYNVFSFAEIQELLSNNLIINRH
jgi:calcineurin-like phosphoesterase family protein